MSVRTRRSAVWMLVLLLSPAAGAVDSQTGVPEGLVPSARYDNPYDANLTITPQEMAKIMYIEPNQTRAANLTVRNPSCENDTILLDLTADFLEKAGGAGKEYNGTGWKVWLSEAILELGGNRTKNVTVSIRGPRTGLPNEYIKVRINASSRLDSQRNESVEFRAYLTYCQSIILKCADKVHSASWNGTTYSIEIQNRGPMEENVSLTLNGPPGWEYYLDRYNVTVTGLEREFVTLTVVPPWNAMCDEVGVVTVIARYGRNLTIYDQITTHTLAYGGMWLELTAPDPEAMVDPGETHVFSVYIINYMNLAGAVNVSLSLNLSSPGWNATLASDVVPVAGLETREVKLTVTAPTDALAGSRLVARVSGYIKEPGMSSDCVFTALVRQVRSINQSSNPQRVELYPGWTANCDLTIRNDGNGDEKLRPEIPAAPDGLDTVLMWPNGTVVDTDDWAHLDARDHFSWRLVLSAAPGCIAGDYNLPAQIRMGDNSTMPFGLEYSILRTRGLDLRAAVPRQTCAPGSNVFFNLFCENTGNGPENVTISLSGLPAGWPTPVFTVRDQDTGGRLALDPFGRARFAVVLAVPPTASCGTVELSVAAYSHAVSSDPVRLSLDVRMPNLVISKVHYFPHTLRLNRETMITVTVWNTGGIAAENITVRFYDNDKTAGNDLLARLPAGANLTATFIWLPHSGKIELGFTVDPDNVIVESNEMDNSAREYIRPSPPPPSQDWSACPFVLLYLVVSAVTLFAIRKRKQE